MAAKKLPDSIAQNSLSSISTCPDIHFPHIISPEHSIPLGIHLPQKISKKITPNFCTNICKKINKKNPSQFFSTIYGMCL